MATNLFGNIKKAYQAISSVEAKKSSQKIQSQQTPATVPDYSSMRHEIQEISHPVSFDFLKIFYGLGE